MLLVLRQIVIIPRKTLRIVLAFARLLGAEAQAAQSALSTVDSF
jgi:hypothetical protein